MLRRSRQPLLQPQARPARPPVAAAASSAWQRAMQGRTRLRAPDPGVLPSGSACRSGCQRGPAGARPWLRRRSATVRQTAGAGATAALPALERVSRRARPQRQHPQSEQARSTRARRRLHQSRSRRSSGSRVKRRGAAGGQLGTGRAARPAASARQSSPQGRAAIRNALPLTLCGASGSRPLRRARQRSRVGMLRWQGRLRMRTQLLSHRRSQHPHPPPPSPLSGAC